MFSLRQWLRFWYFSDHPSGGLRNRRRSWNTVCCRSFRIWSVLVGALVGFNVFAGWIGGTVLSLAIVGVVTGAMESLGIFSSVGDGVTGMYDITVISLLA